MVFNEFFTHMVLPFLLVFVVMFAILQKSKILGDGKAQMDAMVAFVIGLLTVLVPQTRDIIINLMPWLSVGVAVILVFLILYGFVAGDLSSAPKWMKVTFGILAGIFTIGVVLYATGLGKVILGWANSFGDGNLISNVVVVILIIGVVVVALTSSKKAA